MHALSVTVNKDLHARTGLLPDCERFGRRRPVPLLEQARDERGRDCAAVLCAAAILAARDADSERKAAGLDFTASAPRAQAAHERIGTLTTNAEAAWRKLEGDNALRATKAEVIDAGG